MTSRRRNHPQDASKLLLTTVFGVRAADSGDKLLRPGAVLAAALSLFLALPAPAADVEKQKAILDFGLWNNRVQALYDLGEEGKEALPLLVYSSDDADWQVRLTAVHFMGKIGPAAAPALGDIVRVEPCPNVRVSALRWLSGMGPAGVAVLREVMTPEDEREMESLPDRFGTERMGKPLVIDAPGGAMTAEFFDHGPDFRVCASSEYANRRKRRRVPASAQAARAAPPLAPVQALGDAPPDDSFEPVSTPPIRPGKPSGPAPERLPDAPPGTPVAVIEVDPPLPADAETKRSRPSLEIADARPSGVPETMPKAGPGFEPRETPAPREVPLEKPERRAVAAAAPRAPLPPAETMPAAGPGLHREPTERGEAGLVADAGTGKPENDPVPELIRRLSASEPRTRARAADELGKRGAAALPAVPALRRALKDRDRRVRASAVLALGGVGGSVDGVAGDLRRALRDKNEDVRFSAVIALHRLQPAPRK